MIIDVSTRIWSDGSEIGLHPGMVPARMKERWPAIDASADAHDAATSCVDLAFIVGFQSEFLKAHLPAEAVASFVGQAPHRRIGFAGIDPMHREAILDIDRAVTLGLSGISISPAAQNFHPTNSRAMRVYEYCERLGLPVLIEQGIQLSLPAVPLEYARPASLDEVARTFPNLKMVLGSFGYPWIDETLLLIGKHANLFTNTAGVIERPWTLYNALTRAFEAGVLDKVLLASGFPFESPEQSIKRIYSVNTYSVGTELPSIPRSQLRAIVEHDALDCLGLQRPEGASISRGIGRDFDSALSLADASEVNQGDSEATDDEWLVDESFKSSSFDHPRRPAQ